MDDASWPRPTSEASFRVLTDSHGWDIGTPLRADLAGAWEICSGELLVGRLHIHGPFRSTGTPIVNRSVLPPELSTTASRLYDSFQNRTCTLGRVCNLSFEMTDSVNLANLTSVFAILDPPFNLTSPCEDEFAAGWNTTASLERNSSTGQLQRGLPGVPYRICWAPEVPTIQRRRSPVLIGALVLAGPDPQGALCARFLSCSIQLTGHGLTFADRIWVVPDTRSLVNGSWVNGTCPGDTYWRNDGDQNGPLKLSLRCINIKDGITSISNCQIIYKSQSNIQVRILMNFD